MNTEVQQKELTEELYETDFGLENGIKPLPKESVLPNVLASNAIAGISAVMGYLETEMLPAIYNSYFGNPSNPLYQAIVVIGGFGALSLGLHFLTNYAYMKVTKRPSYFGPIDALTSLSLALTDFDTSAQVAGNAKGWNTGYIGYPIFKYEVVKGIGREFFTAPQIGGVTLPSYAHITGILLGVGLKAIYLLNRVKPIKPVERIKNFEHRISSYISSKPMLGRYALKSLMVSGLFSTSTLFTGHPAMGAALASIPVAYGVKKEVKEVGFYAKEYGTYAIEIAKARAESFVSIIRRYLT